MSRVSANPEFGEVSYSWHEVWIRAVLQPSVTTYELITHDPRASTNRAFGWVFISGTIAQLITVILGLFIDNFIDIFGIQGGQTDAVNGLSIVLLVCCAPIIGVGAVLGLAIQTALFQLAARLLGGIASYATLFYALAAYYAPMSLVMSVVLAVPFVGIVLGFLLGLYSIILSIIAMNAVNQFGWGKATAAVVVIPIMITGLTACGAILILTIWGQEIGDAFPDIIKALETPVSTGA